MQAVWLNDPAGPPFGEPDFVRLQAHLPELVQAICAYARSASG
jgi:hypothetical protein